MKRKYDRSDVTEWGIYFYDSDKIITPRYSYTPENFIYKYTDKSLADAACAGFFSETQYSDGRTLFTTTNTEEYDDGYLFTGVCTRIGQNAEKALIFYVLSPEDIGKSLTVVGGEGVSYYLRDKDTGKLLLQWGDIPKEKAEDILAREEWETTSGVKQRVLYDIQSSYPQLEVKAYVSGNSLQNHLIEWFGDMRLMMLCTIAVLLIICTIALYISYKPMYELTTEFDGDGENEFDFIRHRLDDQVDRINEQHMLILDLLVNHLIYGVPMAMEQFTKLGIGEEMRYYCVFLLEGYSFVNSEIEKLTEEVEKELETRVFVTDWQEEHCDVIIAFLKQEDVSALQEKLEQWLQEKCTEECSVYTGKVCDKLEHIQLSFRSCIEQMKKKNSKKQKDKPDAGVMTPKKEQQKKQLEEILAYLEENYRDSNLSQIQVADMFHISNYTLSRLFKNQVGVGFSEYLVAKRLEYAKELLLTTSHTVKEIAAMSGFTSENYFSRTFKLYEGVSPSNFRSQ